MAELARTIGTGWFMVLAFWSLAVTGGMVHSVCTAYRDVQVAKYLRPPAQEATPDG